MHEAQKPILRNHSGGNFDISVKFLEVRVWKDCSRFVTGPEFKPSSLWQSLGADSADAPHCHTSWPAARLTMSRALSGTPAIFQKAKQELINRFISHFAPESIIDNLGQIDGLAAIRRGSKFHGMWLCCWFSPCCLQSPASWNCQVPGLERDAGMLRMGIRCEVPEDTSCVEKRHAAPQVHHLQDAQADRKLRRIWRNSNHFGGTPKNSEELQDRGPLFSVL